MGKKSLKEGAEKLNQAKINDEKNIAEDPREVSEKVDKIITEEVSKPLKNSDIPEVQEQLKDPDLVEVFENPNRQTSREIAYNLKATDLVPGQKIMVILPDDFDGDLKEISLGHRKREDFWNLKPGETRKSWDDAGAYSEVTVFDKKTNAWKSWQDPKGYDPVKFAERRHDVEYENLHDWLHTVGDIEPAAILIRSAGKDPKWSVVSEHSVSIVTNPEVNNNTEEIEHIFSPGTSFVDMKDKKQTLPTYGGGKHERHYNNAIVLGGKDGQEHFPMTESTDRENETLENGQLRIQLPVGVKIKSLEVSIGDTWFRSGGSDHQLGWAKFNAFVKTKNGTERFMDTINVPPQGVLSGGPTDPEYVTQSGDEIILSSQHTSYLMGYRILFDKTETKTSHGESTDGLSFSDLKLSEKNAGGTQGGKWYEHVKTGQKYFVKEYQGNTNRCASEFIANKIYEEMDIPAVKTSLIDQKAVTPEVSGLTHFPVEKKYDKNFVNDFYNHPDIKNGFVVDAWLANWDVFGLDYDNVSETEDGRMLRIDAGGTLFYRGMGQWKQQFDSEEVNEIETMRNPDVAREAGSVFQKQITNEDIQIQVRKIGDIMTDEKISKIVNNSDISTAEKVIEVLIKRRDWLLEKF